MPDHRLADRPVPDRASTPLLTLITQQSLDEDYRVVADQRAARAEAGGGERPRPHWIAAAVVAVFGLLVTVAAVQTSQGEDVRSASRASLITQIDAGRERLSTMQRQIVRLRESNIRLQSNLDDVTSRLQVAASREQRLAATTGFGAVTGPGIRVSVDDAPGTLVADRDLRLLVNGLWAAGAEAVTVNDQRLTARSAIRNSGDAIRVNNRSLSPPYVVEAIGEENTLQADLMQTTTGLLFRDTVDAFGFLMSMDNVDTLTMPAAPARLARLRWAVEGTAEQNQNATRKEAPE